MNPRSIVATPLAALATLFVLSALSAFALPAAAANVDVGVSVQISQPGVYGRIDIGRFPQPQVFVTQPVYVERPRYVVVQPQPVYMWVPPGHRKNWKKHCRDYRACGAPVVFVRDDWYDHNVRPHGNGNGKGKDYEQGRDRGDDRGNSHGNSHGNGNGKGKHGRDD
jgi:hypothetical protein